MRVRHFAQDDAHVFCTEEQIQDEVAALPGVRLRDLRRLRLRAARSSSRPAPTNRLGDDELWDHAEGALRAGAGARRARLHGQRGRRRVLRAEDRPARRPTRSAARGSSAPSSSTTRCPQRFGLDLHRRRQRRAPAGDDPPRADGLLRALHRHPARALRRRAAGLAGAGAGHRPADRRPPRRGRRAACATSCARRACAPSSTTAPSPSGARSATPSCARSPTCSSSATARPRTARSPCADTARATRQSVPVAEFAERVTRETARTAVIRRLHWPALTVSR